MPRIALIAGATGLIGRSLLELLLAEERYGEVIVLSRRALEARHPNARAVITDFEKMREVSKVIRADDYFCTLGTTIRSAGSRNAFRRVDYFFPLELAKIAKESGAKQFLLVSSVGANAGSTNFYLRTKGEIEGALTELSLPSLQILRPSLLVGRRAEFRPAERLAQGLFRVVGPLMIGPLKAYRPIRADAVARAMVHAAAEAPRGVRVIESAEIAILAGDES